MRSARPACAIRLSSSLACLALWGCGADVTSGSTSASVSASASATSAAEVSSSASTERSASPSQRRADLELTPDAFLARGPATLVLGTLGDDRADRDMRAQAEVLRSALPGATVIDDASIDVAGGGRGVAQEPHPVRWCTRQSRGRCARAGVAALRGRDPDRDRRSADRRARLTHRGNRPGSRCRSGPPGSPDSVALCGARHPRHHGDQRRHEARWGADPHWRLVRSASHRRLERRP
jgi:hypothetical protein